MIERIISHLPDIFKGLALAVAFGLPFLLRKRFRIDMSHMLKLMGIIFLFGVLIGPKFFYYLGPWGGGMSLIERLAGIFDPFGSGRVYLGGLIFGILASYFYLGHYRLDIKRYADFLIIPVPLGVMISRVSCYVVGCCHGVETSLPWGIIREGVLIHPTQLYLALNGAILFCFVLYLMHTRVRDGAIFTLYILSYSVIRFIIEFFRDYEWRVFGLSFSQIFLLGIIALSIYLLHKLYSDIDPAIQRH